MKATLEFDTVEDRTEYLQVVHVQELAQLIGYLHEDCRCYLKHGHEFKSPDKVLRAIKARLEPVMAIVWGEL